MRFKNKYKNEKTNNYKDRKQSYSKKIRKIIYLAIKIHEILFGNIKTYDP